jgi:mRNA interferase MazF
MIARGDIVWCDFNPVVVSEQAGIRPAVVVQTDRSNRTSPCTVVVPFTTRIPRGLFPSHVLIPAGEGGLTQDSVALCEQIRVVDQRRIIRTVGQAPDSRMAEIGNALRAALDL